MEGPSLHVVQILFTITIVILVRTTFPTLVLPSLTSMDTQAHEADHLHTTNIRVNILFVHPFMSPPPDKVHAPPGAYYPYPISPPQPYIQVRIRYLTHMSSPYILILEYFLLHVSCCHVSLHSYNNLQLFIHHGLVCASFPRHIHNVILLIGIRLLAIPPTIKLLNSPQIRLRYNGGGELPGA